MEGILLSTSIYYHFVSAIIGEMRNVFDHGTQSKQAAKSVTQRARRPFGLASKHNTQKQLCYKAMRIEMRAHKTRKTPRYFAGARRKPEDNGRKVRQRASPAETAEDVSSFIFFVHHWTGADSFLAASFAEHIPRQKNRKCGVCGMFAPGGAWV